MEPLELFEPLDFLLECDEERLDFSELDFSELELLLDDLRSELLEPRLLESFDDRCWELRSFELPLEVLPAASVEDLAPVSPADLLALRSGVFPDARFLVSPDADVLVLSEVVLDLSVAELRCLSVPPDLADSFDASGRCGAVPVLADGDPCRSAVLLVGVPRSGADVPCWAVGFEVEGLVGGLAGRSASSAGAVTMRPWARTSCVTWV